MITVYGAGSVGLVIGARLARHFRRVLATLERVALDSLGPESVGAAEILGGA
jgi:ketopantoate reductase